MDRYCGEQLGAALSSPRPQPAPEVEALARSPHGAPQTAPACEVQHDNGVRPLEPRFDGVVRPKVTVHDPLRRFAEFGLNGAPLFVRHRLQSGAPEVTVQFHDGQVEQDAEAPGQRRLTRSAGAEDDDPLHRVAARAGRAVRAGPDARRRRPPSGHRQRATSWRARRWQRQWIRRTCDRGGHLRTSRHSGVRPRCR